MEETVLAKATVRVMIYDTPTSSWLSNDSGLSRVQFLHNPQSDTYRLVGWDLSNRKVILNCAVIRGMKYNRARQTFHQWRDSKQQVYGVNFASADEADLFACSIEQALDKLGQDVQQQLASVPSSQSHLNSSVPVFSNNAPVTGEYMMPRAVSASSTRSDDDLGRQRLMTNGSSFDGRFQSSSDDSVKGRIIGPQNPDFRPTGLLRASVTQQSSPEGSLSSRQSDAQSQPPIPPPPPLPAQNSTGPSRLTQPSLESSSSPGEVNGEVSDEEPPQSGFAAELRAAKKLRSRGASVAGQEPPQSSTLGRTSGLDMMTDLQRVLAARRRAQQVGDGDSTDPAPAASEDALQSSKFAASSNDLSVSSTSIVPGYATMRKNSAPVTESTARQLPAQASSKITNGATVSRADLDAFKREVLAEFRREMQQLKNEVIEALRASANRS